MRGCGWEFISFLCPYGPVKIQCKSRHKSLYLAISSHLLRLIGDDMWFLDDILNAGQS